MKVVTLGPKGTYSHEATKTLFIEEEIELKETIKDVLEYASSHKLSAVVPIENSTIGVIQETNELLKDKKFIIHKEINFPVAHCLLANFNINEFSNIKRVYSQINAMNQCEKYISSNLKQVEKVLTKSTAFAAELVKENGRDDEVAIASFFAAKEYGLFIVDEDIQDKADNFTKFVLVSE